MAAGNDSPTATQPILENKPISQFSTVAFIKAREDLIAEEKSQRSDHVFRAELSPTAIQACKIVSGIRAEELMIKWSSSQTPGLPEAELFPGMKFNIAKPHMESTKLWEIIQKMPKGALLHCHLGATVDLEWVFNEALNTPGMCFFADAPLIDGISREKAGVQFLFSKSPKEDGASMWSADYIPKSLVPVTVAADSFPCGGRAGWISWMKDRCSVTQTESLQHHLGVDDVWKKFNSAFTIIPRVIYYEPILRSFLRKLFATLLEDGVRWVEYRTTPFTDFYLEGKEEPETDPAVLCKVLKEETDAFKASKAGKGFWGARMIWSSLRFWNDGRLLADMKHCIRLKKIYPDVISGYDTVGQEDFGRTLEELTPVFLWFKNQCEVENVNIPLFLHAGECVGSGNSTDHNLYTAILLGTRRLGHGFSLYKHPLLIDLCKSQNILVESCPISNEVLRYCASIMSHPLPALINRGVKTSLNNDDPSMLGQDTSGLSHDFWQAIQGWDDLGMEGLGSLAENSVRWAAFEDDSDVEWERSVNGSGTGATVKELHIQEWKAEWEEFCKWVVERFGEGS